MKKTTKEMTPPYLVILAKSASTFLPSAEGKTTVLASSKTDATEIEQKRTESMLIRFALQGVSRRILIGHRVGDCLRKVIPGVSAVRIVQSAHSGAASYRNLIRCGLLWACPVCAASITEKRSQELQKGVANWQNRDGFVIFSTYTMQHNSSASLDATLGTLQRALKRFKSGRGYQDLASEYGIAGTVKALEITYGDSGWHPHVHELIFCLPMSTRQKNRFIDEARERWIVSLRKEGGDGIASKAYDARTADAEIYNYIAKYGRQPTNSRWTIEREIVKSPAKLARRSGMTPFQMLEIAEGEKRIADLFAEYAATMHGVRQLVWSKGMRELLLIEDEKADGELAGEIEIDERLIGTIQNADWYHVLYRSKFRGEVRAEILRLATLGDTAAIDALIKDSYQNSKS